MTLNTPPSDGNPIRVFHLIKSLGRGGAEVLLAEGLRFADQAQFKYGIGYFFARKDAVAAELARHGADVHCFDARSNTAILGSAFRVAQHLRSWQADVLHCHLPLAGAVGRVAARMAGIPTVYTEHNTLERYHRLTRLVNLATWQLQKRVVAVSADVATSLRRKAHPRIPIDVVHNGVDVDRFTPDAVRPSDVRRYFGIPTDAPVVGTVAVFRVQKRLDHWLCAARAIHQQRPDTHFLLLGDGPEREKLVRMTGDLALNNVVHFAGAHDDVRPYLAAMDIFMMSSEFEGMPVALLEAMAMQCACIVTSVGGITEVVRDRSNGLVLPPRDPGQLSKAAIHLLSTPAIRAAYAIEARRTVVAGFSVQRMTRRLEQMYRDLTHKPPRAN